MSDRLRADAGMTIVELLAAITILGVIMVPLAGGIFVGLRGTANSTDRFAASTDAQRVTIYFPPDVQSANSATTTGISCTGVSDAKIQLDHTGTSARTAVYWVRSTADGYELVRSVWDLVPCSNAPTQVTVVARNVAALDAVTATPITDGYQLTVTAKAAQNEASPYTFTVTGKMRVA